MQAQLIENGFAVKIFVCPATGGRKQRGKLEAFIRQYKVSCCVLLSMSTNLKRWFVETSFPALVLGSCNPSIALPSIDMDFRSICRHAAGVFLRNGHRRIAIVIPETHVDGDIASEEGFQEGVEKWNLTSRDPAQAIIVHHNGEAKNLTNRLDMLFNRPNAPTALLIVKPLFIYVVIVYLLRRGLSVPHTVSLISRDSDQLFEKLDPAISHYHYHKDVFAHRATRLAVRVANHGALKTKPSLIFPAFIKCGTYGPPREPQNQGSLR
jgi:DNA-binding LacI/PurR family transcriptional regulator